MVNVLFPLHQETLRVCQTSEQVTSTVNIQQ